MHVRSLVIYVYLTLKVMLFRSFHSFSSKSRRIKKLSMELCCLSCLLFCFWIFIRCDILLFCFTIQSGSIHFIFQILSVRKGIKTVNIIIIFDVVSFCFIWPSCRFIFHVAILSWAVQSIKYFLHALNLQLSWCLTLLYFILLVWCDSGVVLTMMMWYMSWCDLRQKIKKSRRRGKNCCSFFGVMVLLRVNLHSQ